MTAPKRQSHRYSIESMWAEGGQIMIALVVEIYVSRKGWQRHGLPVAVHCPPSMLLAEGVADLVYDEQARQEKAADRDAYNELVERNPQLELPFA